MLIFFLTEFSRHSFLFSFTCRSNYSVYDGECTYTHLLQAHFSLAHIHTSSCVCTYTHWLKCLSIRFFAYVSHLSISPSPVSCFTHPCCSLTVTSRPFLTLTSTRSCRTYLSQKCRACASPHEQREVWLSGQVRPQHRLWAQEVRQDHFCGQWHDAHWRSRPPMKFSDFSTNTHENTGLFGVLTMFESSVSDVSHDDFALQMESKESMPRETDCLTEREKGREKVLRPVLRSRCQRKVDGTILGVILFRLSENSIRRAQQALLVKIQLRENYIWKSTRWRSRIWSKEIQNTHHSSHYWQPIKMQIKLNEREYICVADCGWRTIFIKKAMQEVAEKFEELKKTLLSRKKLLKTTKVGRIAFAAWSGITHSQSILLRSWLTEQLWRTYVPHQAVITSSSRKRSREVGLPRNTRDNMRIPGNVFDRQHARREPDELHNDSRNWAISLAILRKEGIEKSGSEEPLQSIPSPCFFSKNKEKKSRRQISLMSVTNHAVDLGTKTQSITIPIYLSSEMHLQNSPTWRNFNAGSWIYKLKFAQKQRISRSDCSGSRNRSNQLAEGPHQSKINYRKRCLW